VPALPLPDCSSGSRVVFPSGANVILNFVPEGDAAVNGWPVKKVALISFGAMGSADKAALAPKSTTANTSRPRRGMFKGLVSERSPMDAGYPARDLPQAF
jgi:hypothetical protein